jgi:GDP/UDP-N,N'-diacetylbacillosamine 2-epimerase (hydrolysing)
MKIGLLTSSRADFGIYLPLIKALKADPFFELEIIAFGTHLSNYHGYTIADIEKSGFEVKHKISSMLLTDDPASIAATYALTTLRFADLWSNVANEYDWVLCLGDRYEMAAAVNAGIPFNIKFAHIGGGDTTLGAIDNIYRHTITLASKLHFVQLEEFALRIQELAGKDAPCIITGSLSLENLNEIRLLTIEEFKNTWNIDLSLPSILVTIHPETIAVDKNTLFAEEVFNSLLQLNLSYQVIISMPNADTMGTIYRAMFGRLKKQPSRGKVFLIENFGTQSYFSCMKHVWLLLGNSSSGIIEAASFNKYVLNIGDRQKGRLASRNVIHVPFDANAIFENAKKFAGREYTGENIYSRGNATQKILQTLKRISL